MHVGPNGGCIFLPAAGVKSDGEIKNSGNYGRYLSSRKHLNGNNGNYYYHGLYFGETSYEWSESLVQEHSSTLNPFCLVLN